MSKAFSLLRYQLRVLSAYFKSPGWNLKKTKEFIEYSFYYFTNFWYYSGLTIFESFVMKQKIMKKIDKRLAEIYNVDNQYWVSLKEAYQIKSEKIINLTYGETSYLAIKESFNFVKLTKDDCFYDLGCGIGKTVFFANAEYGAKAVGIDIISSFVDNANNVVKDFKLEKINFIKKSIFDANLRDGTVFYVTPTCFDQENMKRLLKKFESLPGGSRLIVLTRALNLPNLEYLGKKKLLYSWGIAETFYYKVK